METKESIAQYLRDNLTISIEQNQEFGPVETIEVKLELEGEEISSSTCSLPNTN